MIDLTPLEVRKKKGDFRRAIRGYDPELVDDFLDLVADRLEQLVRENMTLQERVVRQDEQVRDYRDRERALTEALVSAQEMREEVRRQAVQEAELAKRTAVQQAEQLRASAEAEVRQLRSTAQQQASEELASLRQERQREEQVVRELRARREEFLGSYRALLEQELEELGVIARAAGVAVRKNAVRRSADTDPPSARAAAASAGGGRSSAAEAGTSAAAAAPAAAEGAAELEEEDVAEEAALALGGDRAGAEPEPEPFAPEPFVEDESDLVADAYRAEAAAPERTGSHDAADETPVSEGGAEARLYDGIAGDEDGDDVPGPIGLGPPEPWNAGAGWSMPDLQLVGDETDGDAIELDFADLDDDDDDEEMQTLLRNAAAAGYHLDDEDVTDELLLDEPVSDEDPEPDTPVDDGWLPTLLEDDK